MEVALSDNQIHGKLLIIICWVLLGRNPNKNFNFHKHIELDAFCTDQNIYLIWGEGVRYLTHR